MARKGQTTVTFATEYFDEIMKSAKVDALSKDLAHEALAVAQHTAPVKDGDYKRGLAVEVRPARYRRVYRVVGRDPKTLLVEAKTGNLARALKAV
jgi:hypothetical protein